MTLPKHVRETLAALQAEGISGAVVRKRKHYQITVEGAVVFTLHQGSKDRRSRENVWLRNGIKRLKDSRA